jgi:sec-independent protein translocase protein TatC
VVQPSLALSERWGAGGLERTLGRLEDLSRRALIDEPDAVDLLVWPETAVPCHLRWRPQCRTRVQALADELGVAILTGASDYDRDRREPLNSAFLLRPGQTQWQHYAKMHLVPFGERTPFRDRIPLLRSIDWSALTGDLGPAEFAPGKRRTVFGLPRVSFVVLVCFEAVFPDFTRRSVQQGAQLLVNITNDSWFGATAGPYQHARLVRMRAVENRTPMARCASSGISLFVDAYGHRHGATRLGEQAVSVQQLSLAASRTVYTRYGDWFAQTALALSLLLTLLAGFGPDNARRGPAMTDPGPSAAPTEPSGKSPGEPAAARVAVPIAEQTEPGDLTLRQEMPFLDHLEELRWRILKAIAAVLAGAVICFVFSDTLMRVLTYPYQEAVLSLENQRSAGPVAAIKELLQQWLDTGTAPDQPTTEPIRELPPGRRLQSLKPMTYFFVNLQIALLGGFMLALPVVFYQAWQFIGPGLLRRERRLLIPIVLLSVLCFSVGALIAYWIVVPLGLRFFLALEPPDMTSQWAVDQYISFVMRLLIGFGLVFEMPLISFSLSRVGLVTPAYLRRVRRYAMVAIFVLAAIFTPPDPVSQVLMALPLLLLYEVSIWVSRISSRPTSSQKARPTPT